jgi:hypothetical protein
MSQLTKIATPSHGEAHLILDLTVPVISVWSPPDARHAAKPK